MTMNTETLFEDEVLEQVVEERSLVVFNDDINTFDHVIESLIKVCKHNPIQAEQCTMLIHYTGKCQVKTGEYDKLAEMCTSLHDKGITAEVQ
ncbi:MAG: ATP-dependent Clp protease adaptor ClpS [Brumimicrobium sp.]